ncbi:MAG: acetyl-CoA carboxylase biotin carboxyl carrier protein [Cryomorphaceae bacterium]|nr:MAG: acetyl-CoA carboxylase biotin carboxyl carrier protein [Cryomorphaceae bacterium]
MKLEEIQDLIKFVSKSGVSEVQIEQKDFKIIIKSDKEKRTRGGAQEAMPQYMHPMPQQMMQAPQPAAAAAPAPTPAPAAEAPKAPAEDSKYVTIKSPMIGTFYRSPSPDKDAFVNVGDSVKEGKVICIIEAMKLFNEIESEVSGKIVKVLVDDSSPVEYDQPLFLVDPS